MRTIYIGNLPYTITRWGVCEFLATLGISCTDVNVRIPLVKGGPKHGQPRGLAFALLESQQQAVFAVSQSGALCGGREAIIRISEFELNLQPRKEAQ